MFLKKCFRAVMAGIFVLLSYAHSQAQLETRYVPLRVYNEHDYELTDFLIDQIEGEFSVDGEFAKKTVNASPYAVAEINERRIRFLLKTVKNKQYVHDDTLESYTDKVMRTILERNTLRDHKRRVLVSKSPYVNAACYGRGIYIVTVPLLARVYTEDELAFALAHEMAHDELDHVQRKVAQTAELDLPGKSKEQMRKIAKGTLDVEDLEDFRKLMYDVMRYSRHHELQADSLAAILVRRAGYDPQKTFSMLNCLEHSTDPKYPIDEELFLPFHTEAYPFQVEWLNDRLGIFRKTRESDFMAENDSLKSHPEIERRKKALERILQVTEAKGQYPSMPGNDALAIAEFEAVESAFDARRYDVCLYYAVQLLKRYPKNTYVVNRIGRVLIDLRKARDEQSFHNFVPQTTAGYSEELRLINNFLNNMSTKELGEVTYYFLENGQHFNPDAQSHYYLLAQICDVTYRYDKAQEVRRKFKERFGKSISTFSIK